MSAAKKGRADVVIIRDLGRNEVGAEGVVVKKGADYFLVSSVNALFSGHETLVFRCDAEGKVDSWADVAGGRGMSREEAIEDLAGRDIESEGRES